MCFTSSGLFVLLAALPLCTLALCGEYCIQQKQQERLQEIKALLLKNLGLTSPPKYNSSTSSVSDEMALSLAGDQLEEHEPFEMRLVFANDGGNLGLGNMAAFDLGFLATKQVSEASLFVYLRWPSLINFPLDLTQSLDLSVYEVFADGAALPPIAQQRISIDKLGSYVKISLNQEDIQRWQDEFFLGITVEAVFAGENLAVSPKHATKENERMYLELSVRERNGRSKRSASTAICSEDDQVKGCCLHKLIVDFKMLGWDFVIAPLKFNAYMCNGDCRYNHHHMSSTHAFISRTGKVIDRMGATAGNGSCCHPSEFDAIRIVYRDDKDSVSIKEVPGMVAKKCSCA